MGDVLHFLRAEIVEHDIDRCGDMLEDIARDTNAAGIVADCGAASVW